MTEVKMEDLGLDDVDLRLIDEEVVTTCLVVE